MPPRPFRIDVPDSVLDDLRERLDRTRWPDAIPETGWDYGADIAYVRELCDYWRNEYDWRAQEAALNAWAQFLCEVDGVDIHYWHVRGQGPNPHPLILTHGWPGSMFEFLQLIGPLTDPTAFDRVLATRFGIAAIDAVHDGHSGKATVLQANEIRLAPLEALTSETKVVDRTLYETVAGALVALPD